MSVDFSQPPVALVVHGVQSGEDSDQRQHDYVEATLTKLLSDPELHLEEPLAFTTDIFKYEDINDDATNLVRRVLSSMTGNAVAGWVVDKASDLVGDVLLALSQSETYDLIKQGLDDKIMAIHESGRPIIVVAHSLGTFYALETVNDMFADSRFSDDDKATWPVQGLVTIGSPLGLEIFGRDVDSLKPRADDVTIGTLPRFPWKNYWDRQDPVVTGSIMGFPKDNKFHFRFDRQSAKKKGWSVRSDEVNAGVVAHLAAHTSYWESKTVGQGIINMMYANHESS
jgi:hypothetical protein